MFAIKQLWECIKNGSSCRVEVDGELRAIDSNGTFAGSKVQGSVCHQQQNDFANFALSLRNNGSTPVQIGKIILFTHHENEDSEEPECRLQHRCISGFQDTLHYNYVSKAVSKKHGNQHTSKPFCLIYNLEKEKLLFAAQLTFEKNSVSFEARFNEADAVLSELECIIELKNFTLLPGQEVTCDKIALRLNNIGEPYKILCDWADMVKEIYQPELPEESFIGLTGGTMVSTKAESASEKIRRQLKMVPELRKLGLQYFWISIANLHDGLPGNWLVQNEKNFPEGVRTILNEIQATGIKPGFWINPFYMAEGAADFERMRPYLIKTKEGQASQRGVWLWGKRRADGTLPPLYALDPAQPEALEYIGEIFKQYAEWGIRYYMLDFLDAGVYWENDQQQGFDSEHHRRFMRSLKQFQAPGTHRLVATGATINMVGAACSSRIGLDYCEGRPLEPQFPSYPANYVINGSFGSSGAPNRNAVNNLAMWAFAHKRIFDCNSNMLTIDKPIPLAEARLATTLFGISASPVFLGDDLNRMSPERLAMLKMIMPRGKNMPQPVDLFTKTDVDEDFVRIFVNTIEKPWGKWHVVAIFNLNDDFREVDLPATLLGVQKDSAYRMYDFWEETYCGIYQNQRKVQVPGNNCAVYRLEQTRQHPWILSTDFHILQGEAELAAVKWDEASMTLKGKMQRAAGEKGNLLLISPDEFRERHFNRGLIVAKSALDNSLVIRKRIAFQADCEEWSVEFERWK